MSRKANKAQKEREERTNQSKNKKKKTTEIIPEQEPDIPEEDISEREEETTSEEESVAESTIMPPKANPKRKRQDEVALQPADSLSLMFGYFDKKFEAMQNQIDQKYRGPPRKRAMHSDYSFKSKGNSLQFKFNSELQDDIQDILEDQNLRESTVEALKPIGLKISKRNKLIRIADRPPAGWATIAEYEDDPFASDSEDSKKIRQAENRAIAKNKNKSSFTLSSKPDSTRRPQFWNDVFQHGFNPPPPPFPFFFPPFKSENPPFAQRQEKVPKPTDTCYGCGQTGHWRSRCPKTNQNRN